MDPRETQAARLRARGGRDSQAHEVERDEEGADRAGDDATDDAAHLTRRGNGLQDADEPYHT